jgi:flagellar basal body rod protein FlgG
MIRSGVRFQEAAIENAANNGASSNSVGFSKRYFFSVDKKHGKLTASNNAQDKGTSVGIDSYSPFEQGDLREVSNPLCYSITGSEGYFKLEDDDENVLFTRAGDFELVKVKETDEKTGEKKEVFYLGHGDGFFVIGSDGKRIKYDPNNDTEELDIGVFDVAEHYKMLPVGESRFVYKGLGEPSLDKNAEIEQNSLEIPRVDMPGEAVDLARRSNDFAVLLRAFEKKREAGDKMIGVLGGGR